MTYPGTPTIAIVRATTRRSENAATSDPFQRQQTGRFIGRRSALGDHPEECLAPREVPGTRRKSYAGVSRAGIDGSFPPPAAKPCHAPYAITAPRITPIQAGQWA